MKGWSQGAAAASFVAVAVAATLGATAIVASRDASDPGSLEQRAEEIATGLRCPVCQNLSVADSPSRLAGEIRQQIREMLRAGRTSEQIRRHFVDAYGEWVLLTPPTGGIGVIARLGPAAALVGGAVLVTAVFRRRRRMSSEGPTPADRARIARELAAFEERP